MNTTHITTTAKDGARARAGAIGPALAPFLIIALLISFLIAACAGTPPPGPSAAVEPATATPAVAAAPAPPPPRVRVELKTRPDQVRLDALEQRFASGDVGSFAKANVPAFSSFTLSNGIPVVVKKNDANSVRSLSLVLRGGSLLVDLANAGLENTMLKTMARGSAAWPYGKLRGTLDETSSSFSTESYFEYSLYTLTTLDRYFDELLPIWAGTFTAPGWNGSDFDRVIADAKLALKKKDQDPWQTTGVTMNQAFFEGHPYEATPEGTKESLAALTLAAVKDYYARTWSANRLFVVAVGNYDVASLKADLEKALGGIADNRVGIPYGVPSFAGDVAARVIKKEFAASKGVAYVRGDFAAPAATDADWAATSLAMRLLSDLLFNVVRDKYGAVYTPGSYIRAFTANYGSLTVFKTSVPDKVKAYLDEAVAELAGGKVVSVSPAADEGKFPRQAIAEALPVYKALYVNETYQKIGTNAAVAGEIARSVMEFGDPRAWLLDVDRVAAVGADEVSKALKKWLIDAKVTWVVLGSQDLLDKVTDAEFSGWKLK
jgi:zinc protease